jgi:Na+/melibiose symporter-like transporter
MTTSSISWRIKTFYGLGQAAESIKNFGFGTLLLLYYNQVLGLSGTYSGIAVFIAVAVDAISDPAVGSWSDGFRHRLGRRHLFMYAGAVPLGITYYFLFWPPGGLTEFQLFLWFTSFAVLSRTALTFFHVPYLSLGAEMSLDYQERTQIVALRTAFGMVASLLVIVFAWNFFFIETADNASPQLERAPYFKYALLSAIVMTGMMMVSTWGTISIIPLLTQTKPDHPPFSLKQVYRDLYDALKNPSFAALFWGSLIFMIYAGVHGALNMHVWTFFWELEARGIEYAQYGAIVGGLIGLAVLGMFHRWLDKRMTLIIGVVITSVAGTLPVLLKMMGFMPEDQSVLIPVLVSVAVLSTFGILHAGASSASMMGDIADEHELEHDRRQEGVYFGSHNFALKCTGAMGNLIAGFALDIVNFPVNSKPGEIPEGVLFDFGLVYVVIAVMIVAALWVFWPYNMSRERHAGIRAELSRRKSEANDPNGVEGARTASESG